MPETTTGTAQDNNVQSNQSGADPQAASETQATWETILATLPEETQALYSTHVQGLRSARESERRAHRDLAGQLREASQQAEAGSKLKTQLEQLESQLEEQTRKADFATEATGQGVANIRLAYLAAQEFDVIDRRGIIDWKKLQVAAPELFRQSQPARGNAGAGTAAPPSPAADMNAFIRRAAGRSG